MSNIPTTEESSLLIAVYMGGKITSNGNIVDFGAEIGRCYKSTLLFNRSADALMPVIAKLMRELETYEGGASRDIQAQIRHKLQTAYKDIAPVYKEVVRGIEYINQVRKLNN